MTKLQTKTLLTLWLLVALVGAGLLVRQRTVAVAGFELKMPRWKPYPAEEEQPLLAMNSDSSYHDNNHMDARFEFAKMEERKVDTARHRILMLGESMVEGLYLALRKYAHHNGHEIKAKIWYSSSTKDWAESDSIRTLIEHYKPTIVLVSIGSNELSVRNILEERDAYMSNIRKQLGNQPFIWIGPPNWKKDTGINKLIQKHVPKDQFFESKRLTYQRRKDGAHPTLKSAYMWADSLAVWIQDSSRYPIRLVKPSP